MLIPALEEKWSKVRKASLSFTALKDQELKDLYFLSPHNVIQNVQK